MLSSKSKKEVLEEVSKNFIGIFEEKITQTLLIKSDERIRFEEVAKISQIKMEKYKEIQNLSNLNLDEKFRIEVKNILVSEFHQLQNQEIEMWVLSEKKVLDTSWRSANNSYIPDKVRIEANPFSVVLFEDLQSYLIMINQDYFKIQLINGFFENLGKFYKSFLIE